MDTKGPTIQQRSKYLSKFQGVQLKFGAIQQSHAWPMVNAIITRDDKKSSHLFQIQHDWNSLLKNEVQPLVDTWGCSEFAVEQSPFTSLTRDYDCAIDYDLSTAEFLNSKEKLSENEYVTQRQKMLEYIRKGSGEDSGKTGTFRKHVLATRVHFTVDALIPELPADVITCECGKNTDRAGSEFAGKLVCAICGTKVVFRKNDEEREQQISSLLIPFSFSFFEFMVNDHHWLIEVAEQDNGSGRLKYYFLYEKQWLHVTLREFHENPIFKLLKSQVIGALIALETNAVESSNHPLARPAPTPAMMERLRKVYKREFNFGYSVIDLTKKTKSRTSDDNEPDHEPAYRVRLHFRRGYWRVRLGKLQRVRWCLVGDPSMGFIDKHYRF